MSRQQGLEFGCKIAQEVRGLSRCLVHHHCSLYHFCRHWSFSSEDLRERQQVPFPTLIPDVCSDARGLESHHCCPIFTTPGLPPSAATSDRQLYCGRLTFNNSVSSLTWFSGYSPSLGSDLALVSSLWRTHTSGCSQEGPAVGFIFGDLSAEREASLSFPSALWQKNKPPNTSTSRSPQPVKVLGYMAKGN